MDIGMYNTGDHIAHLPTWSSNLGLFRWVTYTGMTTELEKEYVIRQLQSIKKTTGAYPLGWYYGALSPYSKAIIHEVYQEMDIPLLYESDTYADDLPYWVDVPAEKHSDTPKGMLMIPYRHVSTHRLTVMSS